MESYESMHGIVRYHIFSWVALFEKVEDHVKSKVQHHKNETKIKLGQIFQWQCRIRSETANRVCRNFKTQTLMQGLLRRSASETQKVSRKTPTLLFLVFTQFFSPSLNVLICFPDE